MIMFWSQISQQNWVTVALSVLLLPVTGFFAFKAYRNKRDSKFRELAIISVLALVAMVLISISNFQTDQASNNQVSNLSAFYWGYFQKTWASISRRVYVNTSAATDGAILKVGKEFFIGLWWQWAG